MLQVHTDFPRAWRLVGIALNRVGFTVEDRNRSTGEYFVRYNDPNADQPESTGWMSKMAFWRSSKKVDSGQRYIINVSEQSGADTMVTVNKDAGAPASAATASRILTLLNDQLR
jgi:outer membrane protein assembly factor BamC